MILRLGIVGLPNAGKSTLFNALLSRPISAVADYPFTTIVPHIGSVPVPDGRLAGIAAVHHPKKVTPATVELVDIAGLVKGASAGEGLGNRFLGHIREMDALIHVVRCFEDPRVPHVHGSVDPARDIEVVETELALADLDTIEERLKKIEKKALSGESASMEERRVLLMAKEKLDRGDPLRPAGAEQSLLQTLHLLTLKPVVYLANVSEREGEGTHDRVREIQRKTVHTGSDVLEMSGRIEAEIGLLPEGEKKEFLASVGFHESGLARLMERVFRLLDLVTFFTVNEEELRAWAVPRGIKAPQAAGRVHSDMERGFIKAEVMTYSGLMKAGPPVAAREKGLLKVEGRDYDVQDGDILYFRFKA